MHRLTRRIPAPPSTYSSSSDHEPQLSVSFANLPVSQQAISMAFQVLDKDEDGRITRLVAAGVLVNMLGCQQTPAEQLGRMHAAWAVYLNLRADMLSLRLYTIQS